ncbi:serpin family protein [Bacillus atrophaeus]
MFPQFKKIKPCELSLTVNRPFLFVIADEKTKSILFLGTVAEPAE